jgi:HEPN domain-containing protein
MRPIDDAEVAAWLSKARADLKMSELAVGADTPMWDQACFHAQQCAEKSLKALLVASDLDVPRSHDLVFVLDRLRPNFPSIEALADAAALLTQHGVAPRYPSYLVFETEEDAQTAISHAEMIQVTVLAFFNQ